MKKLGQGWQYTAYDLGNGRVLKRYNSWWQASWIVLKDVFPFRHKLYFWRIPLYVRSMRHKAEQSLAIVRRRDIPAAWLANPKTITGLHYEQDKIIPLGEILRTASLAEGKKLIDQFVTFNESLLEYGIIEKSFAIGANFGLNKQGKVVLIDLGEVFEDVALITRQRKKRAWTARYVLKGLPTKELRQYFVTQMDRHFELKNRG